MQVHLMSSLPNESLPNASLPNAMPNGQFWLMHTPESTSLPTFFYAAFYCIFTTNLVEQVHSEVSPAGLG